MIKLILYYNIIISESAANCFEDINSDIINIILNYATNDFDLLLNKLESQINLLHDII